VKITGIQQSGRTATVLLRGSNKLALAEADRSLHDALCVVRCLVQVRRRLQIGDCWLAGCFGWTGDGVLLLDFPAACPSSCLA
jgi:chaperonin GroEL (HSP60 family)